ncbi:ParB/RepB/Spo0J family partition protein [Eleftheria terrae]|uniref:ParB/RepB/Spo0J family partition protein n=1 Tax=Eleftheria terrae TaxID=1597781 RepID=UPI00263B2001|nr:ParB/RepB/Spo0J family partition protein [Eleftheria terrae]WKB50531.1 ParB/RepB/Spo0J family partition protein [Eleftheria terrae]
MSMSDSFINDILAAQKTRNVLVLHYGDVRPDPNQPRKTYSQEAIEDLAESFKSVGQLQPIVVRLADDGYVIVVGERRWRASQLTPAGTVEAIEVDEQSAGKILAIQLVENNQREAVDPVHEAMAWKRLIEMGVCKNAAAVAKMIGRSEPTISQGLKLLTMPAEVQELVQTRVSGVDAALDLAIIQQNDPEAAAELVSEAKAKGKLERAKTREVKQQVAPPKKAGAAAAKKAAVDADGVADEEAPNDQQAKIAGWRAEIDDMVDAIATRLSWIDEHGSRQDAAAVRKALTARLQKMLK